jgi:transcriptional regulator with XRE-family HTH domain
MTTNVTTNRLALLTPDKDLFEVFKEDEHKIKGRIRLHLFDAPGMGKTHLGNLYRIFLVSRVEDISKVDKGYFEQAGDKRFIFFCSNIQAVEDLPAYMAMFRVHSPERMYVTFETPERSSLPIVRRLVAALSHGEDHEGILDVRIEGDELRVVSAPSLKRLRIPSCDLPSLRGRSDEDLRRFEIDDDGSFIYWPRLDVHLGWEQLLQASNPAEALKAKQQSKDFNRGFGHAIRKLRNELNISQEQIGGLTARQVSRIEKGECRATSSALAKLAAAHKLSTNEYMDRLARLFGQKTQHPLGLTAYLDSCWRPTDGQTATEVKDGDVQRVFRAANRWLAHALAQYGMSPRSLNFVGSNPGGVRHSGVEYYGRDIAVNTVELRGASFAAAVGILGHEYGHVKSRTTADGRFLDVGQRARTVEEEAFCDWFSGVLLGLLGLPPSDYTAFLNENEPYRNADYPPLATSVNLVQHGFRAARVSLSQNGRLSAAFPARQNNPNDWVGIALLAGMLICAGLVVTRSDA